jgi:hypothetical protein
VSAATDPMTIARAWIRAAQRCDLAAIESGMAETCLRYGEPDWIETGKAAYIEGYRRFLETFSDYSLEVLNARAWDRTVVFEMIESATLKSNGRSYCDRVCTWLEIDETGKVAEIRAYVPSARARLLA